jgi:hypothetical protein
MKGPPNQVAAFSQGYIISNALQWRLQYGHAISNAGSVNGVQGLVS